VHVDLAELRGQPAAAGLEQGWSTARAAAAGIPGSVYLTGPDADAAACDAALTPIVTGHIDWAVLDHLTSLYLQHTGHREGQDADPGQDTDPGQDAGADPGQDAGADPGHDAGPDQGQDAGPDQGQDADPGQEADPGPDADPGQDQGQDAGRDAGAGQDAGPGQDQDADPGRDGAAESAQDDPGERSAFGTGCTCPVPHHRTGPGPLHPATRERLQHTLLQWSIDLLSGPAGFPACLRTHLLPARFTSLSQPPGLGRTPGWSHPTCAKPSSSGTRNAGSPAASSPPRSARSTTSSPGPRAAPPPSATWHFSAGTTTASSSTAGAGTSPATPTEPPPPPHPTDAHSTPTDHPGRPPDEAAKA